jgi:hypothetical protein
MDHVPDDFDWVAAQAKCSAASMFDRLRTHVREDVQRRNGLFDREDGWKFEFDEDGDAFEASRVVTAGGFTGPKVAALVRFERAGPRIHVHSEDIDIDFTAVVTLDVGGLCRFVVGEAMYSDWASANRPAASSPGRDYSFPDLNPPRPRLVRLRRTADEHAPRAPLEKARFDEVPKQHLAHLSVEACHLRGVSGGELRAGYLQEQMLDTCERLFETPRLEWLRHGLGSSQLLAISASGERDRIAVPDPWLMHAEIAFAHRRPRVVPGL